MFYQNILGPRTPGLPAGGPTDSSSWAIKSKHRLPIPPLVKGYKTWTPICRKCHLCKKVWEKWMWPILSPRLAMWYPSGTIFFSKDYFLAGGQLLKCSTISWDSTKNFHCLYVSSNQIAKPCIKMWILTGRVAEYSMFCIWKAQKSSHMGSGPSATHRTAIFRGKSKRCFTSNSFFRCR